MSFLRTKTFNRYLQRSLNSNMTTLDTQITTQMANLSIRSALSATEFSLRSYQLDAMKAVRESIKEGFRRNAVVLATGGGKTVVFSHLIPQLSPLDPAQGNKTLVLAHRQELVLQASAAVKRFNPLLNVQIDMQKHKPDENADVIVASVSTLARLTRLHRYEPSQFKTIILDECHHATANVWTKILTHFNANHLQLKINVVGFTATLERADGVELSKAFDNIAYERSLANMIKNGELCDISYHTLDIKVDLLRARTSVSRDFTSSSLEKIMNQLDVCEKIAGAYIRLQKEFQFKLTMIFCCSIDHCISLCSVLQSLGVNAQYVTGTTKLHNRMDIVDDFRSGKIPVLCNVLVFTEGTDIPNIDSLLLARPTKSRSLLVQMVGRGLRLHRDKTVCHVVDIADTSHVGLVSVPTLIGLDLEMVKRGNGGSERVEKEEEEEIVDLPLEELSLGEDGIVLHKGSQAKVVASTVKINTIEGFATLMMEKGTLNVKTREISTLFGQSPLNWIRLGFETWGVPLTCAGHFLTIYKVEENEDEPIYGLVLNTFTTVSQKIAADHKVSNHKEVLTIMKSTDVVKLLNEAKSQVDQATKITVGWVKVQLFKQHGSRKGITQRQVNALEKLEKKLTQLYDDPQIGLKLRESLLQISSWRASNLIFAFKYLVNSIWVLWELEQMLGLSDKKKRQIQRMVAAKKKEFRKLMQADMDNLRSSSTEMLLQE